MKLQKKSKYFPKNEITKKTGLQILNSPPARRKSSLWINPEVYWRKLTRNFSVSKIIKNLKQVIYF